jgi:hypothetical protein
MWDSSSIAKVIDIDYIPVLKSPMKKGRVGRRKLSLAELEEDTVRYQFYLLLAAKEYPTSTKLLSKILQEIPHFPVKSKTSLRRRMYRNGFKYKATSKAHIPSDATSFIASRANVFRHLSDVRESDLVLYYYDETGSNSREEKRQVLLDENGVGRLRKNEGKDKAADGYSVREQKDVLRSKPRHQCADQCTWFPPSYSRHLQMRCRSQHV